MGLQSRKQIPVAHDRLHDGLARCCIDVQHLIEAGQQRTGGFNQKGGSFQRTATSSTYSRQMIFTPRRVSALGEALPGKSHQLNAFTNRGIVRKLVIDRLMEVPMKVPRAP